MSPLPFRSPPRAAARCSAPWALAALLALAGMLSAPAQAGSTLKPCADEAVAQAQWLAALNALRAQGVQCGGEADPPVRAPALHWAGELAEGARHLAEDLAAHDRVAHTDSEDRDFAERMRASGYPLRAAGENIAAGQSDFLRALRAWVASPSHCRTMMRPRYTEVGLACFERADSSYGRYWVAHFGQRLELHAGSR